MNPRTWTLLLLTLSAAVLLGTAAAAGDLPKEGSYSVTYSSAGTIKPYPIGKERVMSNWDENGLSVGNGLLDHITWHCFGLYEAMNGMAQAHGYCIGTDPAGDQMAADVGGEKYAADAKSFGGKGTFTAATGKYAGISGSWTYTCHGPEFKTTAEGTYAQYCTTQGNYKLP